jgi:peptidyl-prolyl cis-trans isomerase SurA
MKSRIFALLLAACSMAAAQEENGQKLLLDDIAAVVGGEIILSSQIKMAVLQAAQQNKIEFSDTAALRQLSEEILNAEIASRVLLHHAKEAKIEITDDQVNQLVENRLNEMRRNFPSETAFQSALEEAGQTLLGLKEIYREQVREDILRQNYLQEHSHEFPRVKVSEEEAREFFESQPVGTNPEQVKYQHMIVAPKPGEKVLAEAKARIDSIYKLYQEGADFAYLAERHSDGPSAAKGGDLGFFSKGDMVKEFEEAAFDMRVGEVRMVKTKYGWHLVRVEARRQKEVKARHILAATEIGPEDWERAEQLAESLRQRVLEGESFYKLAKEYGEDTSELAESPGFVMLGNIQPVELQNALYGPLTAVPNKARRISDPILTKPHGYLLVFEIERKKAAPLQFKEVSQRVINQLQQTKAIEAYIEELRKKTYIDIRFKGWTPLAGGL